MGRKWVEGRWVEAGAQVRPMPEEAAATWQSPAWQLASWHPLPPPPHCDAYMRRTKSYLRNLELLIIHGWIIPVNSKPNTHKKRALESLEYKTVKFMSNFQSVVPVRLWPGGWLTGKPSLPRWTERVGRLPLLENMQCKTYWGTLVSDWLDSGQQYGPLLTFLHQIIFLHVLGSTQHWI